MILATDVLVAQRGHRAATTIVAYRSDRPRFALALPGSIEGATADDVERYRAAMTCPSLWRP
jgi:hypothetical protein